jgi:hypothetical protein
MSYEKTGGYAAPKAPSSKLPKVAPGPAPGQIVEPPPGLRQEFAAKATDDKLNAVLQQIADADGRVEHRHPCGGRDWIIFWSQPVVR